MAGSDISVVTKVVARTLHALTSKGILSVTSKESFLQERHPPCWTISASNQARNLTSPRKPISLVYHAHNKLWQQRGFARIVGARSNVAATHSIGNFATISRIITRSLNRKSRKLILSINATLPRTRYLQLPNVLLAVFPATTGRDCTGKCSSNKSRMSASVFSSITVGMASRRGIGRDQSGETTP